MNLLLLGYKCVEFYPDNSHISLITCYNSKNEIIEWYFDIAKFIGFENDMPYELDLYLDVVMYNDGRIEILDLDELNDALKNKEITIEDYNLALETKDVIYNKINGNKEKLKKFADKYLKIMLDLK